MVYRVEKSYVDKLVARNPLLFCLLRTSPDFLFDQNQFLFEVSYMRFDSSKTGISIENFQFLHLKENMFITCCKCKIECFD